MTEYEFKGEKQKICAGPGGMSREEMCNQGYFPELIPKNKVWDAIDNFQDHIVKLAKGSDDVSKVSTKAVIRRCNIFKKELGLEE